MSRLIVVGGQWGDEGKGKVVDWLTAKHKPSVVVRFNGGGNAGHTVVNDKGTFKFHLVPSGVFHKNVKCVLGNGMVIDPEALEEEIRLLKSEGVRGNNILISDKAHLVMPWHFITEDLYELFRERDVLGTTKKGIGPAYADKAARIGIRFGEFVNEEIFKPRLEGIYKIKNREIKAFGKKLPKFRDILNSYLKLSRKLKKHVTNTEELLEKADSGKGLLIFEGAQGSLLDLEWGIYNKVTSSATTRLGVYQGTGLLPRINERVVGIYKGYVTRVGAGYLPTQMDPETEARIRKIGSEFGATTGRPRRCGWFDAVLAKYSAKKNGLSEVALTKTDVLDELSKIKVCVAYKINGRRIKGVPSTESEFSKCLPVYEEVPGWETSIRETKTYRDLPTNFKKYCKYLEKLIGVKISIVSLGPSTHQTVQVKR